MLKYNRKYLVDYKKIKFSSIENQETCIENFLSDNKLLFITGEINDLLLGSIFNNYLYFYKKNSSDYIKILINSPGGSTMAGLSIVDIIHASSIPTCTVSLGISASISSVVLCTGKKGYRSSFPNSRILLYQPLGGVQGNSIDIEIQTKELLYLRNNINYILSKNTGQEVEKIEIDSDNERYLTPKDALEYGIIDSVLNTSKHNSQQFSEIGDIYYTKKENINWNNLKYLFIN